MSARSTHGVGVEPNLYWAITLETREWVLCVYQLFHLNSVVLLKGTQVYTHFTDEQSDGLRG